MTASYLDYRNEGPMGNFTVNIPKYYNEAASYINEIENESRILLLPQYNYDFNHFLESGGPTDYPLLYGLIKRSKIIPRGSRNLNNLATFFNNEFIFNNLVLYKKLNVKYIILMMDADTRYSNNSNQNQNPIYIEKILNESKNFKKIKEFGVFNEDFIKKIKEQNTRFYFLKDEIFNLIKNKSPLVLYEIVNKDFSQIQPYTELQILNSSKYDENMIHLLNEDKILINSSTYDKLSNLDSRIKDKNKNQTSIEVKKINQSEFEINVKDFDEFFYLNLSNKFNKKWKIYFENNKQPITSKAHFFGDLFSNNWLISNKTISELEYQKEFKLTLKYENFNRDKLIFIYNLLITLIIISIIIIIRKYAYKNNHS